MDKGRVWIRGGGSLKGCVKGWCEGDRRGRVRLLLKGAVVLKEDENGENALESMMMR